MPGGERLSVLVYAFLANAKPTKKSAMMPTTRRIVCPCTGPIVARAAMKPISTLLQGIDSVDLATGTAERTTYERSDFCALPRAVPVGEAMLALTLADALLEKLGGDSLDELRPRLAALRRAHIDDLPMDNREWRFGYQV